MEEIKGDPHRAAAQIIATAEGFPLELETAWIYREIEERLPKALVGVLQDRAAERYHSTSVQAASLAAAAAVKQLLIGHFSSKYTALAPFLEESRPIFTNTEIAEEGVTYFV